MIDSYEQEIFYRKRCTVASDELTNSGKICSDESDAPAPTGHRRHAWT